MKRKKSNLIMNLALICALTIIAVLPLPVAEAANLGISKTNVSLETGKDTTITISAVTHTGRLDIISSNVNVATVSESSLWVENNSKTITISGSLLWMLLSPIRSLVVRSAPVLSCPALAAVRKFFCLVT